MPYGFRILGPVGLACDGRDVTLGPPKRRALLAALLLDANHPVPLPALSAAMWGLAAPDSAVANLRTHAWQLRHLLGGRLVARPRAYELRVDPVELDAAEFHRLARAGRAALAERDLPAAAQRLGQALALWRGRAGDGLPDGTALEARLTALDEQRLDAFEDWVQARLHTRAYPEIAADLRQHLATCPVRERSWELLMLALYRAGNVSGVLSAYADARAALRDQLGIEPGHGLQRLQRMVLERDPELDDPDLAAPDGVPAAVICSCGISLVPRPRRPLDSPPASRQLPPDLVDLVGRERDLAALTGALRSGGGVVAVTGRAGVGKSALALRAAHLVADEFPHGCLALDLGGTSRSPRRPADLVTAVLLALGASTGGLPTDAGELAAGYRALTAGHRVLILLDDAGSAAQIRPLHAGPDGPTLLVTGRRRPAGLAGVRHIEVRPLPDRDAVRLLAAHAGAERVAPDPAAVRRLARVCDGLPLALRIVGERLARRPGLPVRLLAAHLARRPLDGLWIDDLSARDALEADFRAVSARDPVAARALLALGELDPGATLTPEALAERLGVDPSRAFYALEHLVDARLADSPQPGRYRTTGLPHAYAAELAAGAQANRTDLRTHPRRETCE
jgi:DNA-binding SARP family transcriptional activator